MSINFKIKTIYDETDYIDIDKLVENYKKEYPEEEEETLRNWAENAAESDLDAVRSNINTITIPNGLLIMGRIGRWWANGSADDIRPVKCASLQGNIGDGLKHYCDSESYIRIYVDEDGELNIHETDHDASSDYVLRAWKKDVSENEKHELMEKLCRKIPCPAAIESMTYRLGDVIGDMYGWQTPYANRPQEAFRHSVHRFLLSEVIGNEFSQPVLFLTLEAAQYEMAYRISQAVDEDVEEIMSLISKNFGYVTADYEAYISTRTASCETKNHDPLEISITELDIPVDLIEMEEK